MPDEKIVAIALLTQGDLKRLGGTLAKVWPVHDALMRIVYAELRRFPSVSRIHFLECSGNTLADWTKPVFFRK